MITELIRPYLRWLYLCIDPGRRPDYFSAPWRYPCYRIGPDLAGHLLPPADRPDFFFFPMNDWHTRIQRSHHFARGLAGLGHRCFWFNPHLGCQYRLPYLFDPHTRAGILGNPPLGNRLHPQANAAASATEPAPGALYEIHVHLPREHAFHRRLLRPSESAAVFRAVEELVSCARSARAVQIVSFPIWLDAALAAKRRFGFPIVYDCHDFLAGFQNTSRDIAAAETALFEAADLVVFSAGWLMRTATDRCPAVRAKSALIRNGVDAARFASAPAREPRSGGAVTAGYVGALDHWFDIDAVSLAARDHPHWTFLLGGRVEDPRILSLRDIPNVRFLGEVPYGDVPALLSTLDVAIIPFQLTELTLAANPIKLYEYFSLGLPVVSAHLPEVEPFSGLVYLADTPARFSAELDRAAAESAPELRQRRINIARRESWSSRITTLLSSLHPFYPVHTFFENISGL